MNKVEFLQRIPKAEIHCHIGIPAEKLVDLAQKNNVALPRYQEPADLHEGINSLDEFLAILSVQYRTIQSTEDFHEITYYTLSAASKDNVRYREMAWNPTIHIDMGVPYDQQIEGINMGIKDAEADFGIVCRMVAAINREDSVERAKELVEILINKKNENVIGLGLDWMEEGNHPAQFSEPFLMAKKAGFGCVAHEGEVDTGPSEILSCLKDLKCDRLDHGYRVLLDKNLTQMCADEGIPFGVVPAIHINSGVPRSSGDGLDTTLIKTMVDSGIKISLNSDDPHFHNIGPAQAYMLADKQMGFTPQQYQEFVMNALDGSWLDERLKKKWKREWAQEIDDLILQLEIE